MTRHRLLHCHTGFSEPLRLALAARGVAADVATIDAVDTLPHDQLDATLACVIWFYEPMRSFGRLYGVLRLKRRLRRHGIPLFAWNQDAPHYLNRSTFRLGLIERLKVFDLYATHTLIDTHRIFAPHSFYLANAADVRNYHLGPQREARLKALRDPAAYRVDVSFFGGRDGRRYKEDRARDEFFTALAERLDRLGITHDFREARGMDVGAQREFIQSSRINLNFGARCEYGAPVASGLPERCFGIPACGGFLLCDRRTHAQTDFTPGLNWAEFDGLDDCVAQIRHWLAHFDDARDLAERCHHHVMTHHTYTQRAQTLHDALRDWHAERTAA